MKNVWKRALVLLTAGLLLLPVFAGCADPTPEEGWAYIQNKGTIILGFDDAFAPMGFKDVENGGTYRGFDIDVAGKVAEKLGLKLELKPVVWETKEADLSGRKIDVIWNGYTVADTRDVVYSIPYMKNEQIIVIRSEDEEKYLNAQSLSGKKILCQNGSTAETAIKNNQYLKDNELVKPQDNVMALTDLGFKRAEALVMDSVIADYYLAKPENAGKFLTLEGLADEEYAVGFRRYDTVFAEKVNDALRALKEEGVLAQISEQWFGKDKTIVA